MARYIRDFHTSVDIQTIHAQISQYLQSEGYEYIEYDGENVFKKGQGFWCGPTFFKFSYYNDVVRMETWMKYAFFPGVYVGELDLDGFVACLVKGPWKARVANLERMLSSQNAQTRVVFCNNCGTQMSSDALFCTTCGKKRVIMQNQNNVQQQYNQNPYTTYTGCNISRKTFIENYLQPSLKKNITSIAILCYVCAGLTFIASCLVNPAGIIDALLLAGLALGMHLAKSSVCAILILVLSIIEVIFSLFVGGFPIWWLIAGISAVVTFNKIEKEYKQFLNR